MGSKTIFCHGETMANMKTTISGKGLSHETQVFRCYWLLREKVGLSSPLPDTVEQLLMQWSMRFQGPVVKKILWSKITSHWFLCLPLGEVASSGGWGNGPTFYSGNTDWLWTLCYRGVVRGTQVGKPPCPWGSLCLIPTRGHWCSIVLSPYLY